MAAKDNKDAQALPEGQAEKPKKKSKLKRIVIILAILLMTLSGAGLGGYWWFFLRTPSAEMAEEAPAGAEGADAGSTAAAPQGGGAGGHGSGGAANAGNAGGHAQQAAPRIERQSDLPRSTGHVVPLPPVTVNLSDPGGRRYLKLGMEVELNSDVSAAIKSQAPRIRDAIIMLLAGKSFADISTPDGKVILKAEVAARLNQVLGAQRVVRVYFTDFVVE